MSRFSFSRVDAAAQLDQGDGGGKTATPLNLRRVCAFATFSGAYAGCFQHFMYNIVFFKLFGEGTRRSAIAKVVADSTVHTPFICLPLYYMFESTALGGSPEKGLMQYSKQWWEILSAYWCMWPAFHFLNFRFTRPELRIGAVAVFSYFWLIVQSFVSHKRLAGATDGG